MPQIILVINAGSSSIKFALFAALKRIYHGGITHILSNPALSIYDDNDELTVNKELRQHGHEAALGQLFAEFANITHGYSLVAIGHRVVHGGTLFTSPVVINEQVIKQLESLNPLAPLHQPHNIAAIQIAKKYFPHLPQVACFDTAFHTTQTKLAKLFALPRHLIESGVIRYGFHGLSYEYIATHLEPYFSEQLANGRVIVAHLGNGASMCALLEKKSIDTSMGFTAVDGLMMGTRTGSLDPGVISYLLAEKHYTVEQIDHLLYNESGLLGVSGITNDMQKLLNSDEPNAKDAVDLFCYCAAKHFAKLTVAIGGCDLLVFTAGIGENAPIVRAKICAYLAYMGVKIADVANEQNDAVISSQDSAITVGVIKTNEEYIIAKHTDALL